MAVLEWDKSTERYYETGGSEGVLYTKNAAGTWVGTAWNGLISVTETPSGAEANALYADDIKYLNLISKEELGGTIEAYQSPAEFDECDGTKSLIIGGGLYVGQQERKEFALCYKTRIGNDDKGADYAAKYHIIYGCKASPSDRQYSTMNDSPEAMTLSWEFTTTPVKFTIKDASNKDVTYDTSIVTIETDKVADADKLKLVLDKLHGTASTEATLLMPNEVYDLLK